MNIRNIMTIFVLLMSGFFILSPAISSSDSLDIWYRRDSGTAQSLYGIAYGSSTFVTVGNNGTILTSCKLHRV